MGAIFVPSEATPLKVAVIDPGIPFGEPGQYTSLSGTPEELLAGAYRAKESGKEVRLYYQGLKASNGESVATKVIETWIPPGHVQPFHTHHQVHEMTLVIEGVILAIDDESLTEEEIRNSIAVLEGKDVRQLAVHDMIIEGPGTRHTIANPIHQYARIVTVQTARMPIESFSSDWHRDKPAA